MKIKMAKKGIKKIGVVDRISKNRRGQSRNSLSRRIPGMRNVLCCFTAIGGDTLINLSSKYAFCSQVLDRDPPHKRSPPRIFPSNPDENDP